MQISIKGSGDSQSLEFSGVMDLISGQSGVAGGSGVVGANTQRVTLGSDDPAVASLALISASMSVLDDWDESDRAKVNLIAGQAGIDAGVGASSAKTPRVVLATQATVHACTESSVAASATSAEILAANGARTGSAIRNDSTVAMWVSKGGTASSSSPVKIEPQTLYELPLLANGEVYRGAINAIWESATGYARIEEYV